MSEYEKYFPKDIPYNTLKFPDDPKHYKYSPEEVSERNTLFSNTKSTIVKYCHNPTNTFMAVKRINLTLSNASNFKENIDKDINEVKMHYTLQHHSNIIDFYGFFIKKNNLHICLELMDMSLQDIYKRVHECYGHFPEHILGVITVAVVDGLDYCRKKDIMHRDLKPANILIKWSGAIKIADFGVSRVLKESLASTTVGTYPYWPPERFKITNLQYNTKADIWSLGFTLLELVWGTLPHKAYRGAQYIADDLISIQNCIKNLSDPDKTEQMINQCFAKRKFYLHGAIELIKLCLSSENTRPNKYGTLKEKSFYLKYRRQAVEREFNNIKNFYCALCNVTRNGQVPWNDHIKTVKHTNNLENIQKDDFREQVVTRYAPMNNSESPSSSVTASIRERPDQPVQNNDVENNNGFLQTLKKLFLK